MARAGLFDVPGDESGQGAAAGTLRIHVEPELCRASGPRRAHAPDVPRNGRGCSGDRAPYGRPRADGRTKAGGRSMAPFTRVEGRTYPLPLDNVDSDLIIRAEHRKTIGGSDLRRHASEAIRA